ncbi:hypothetical protein [Olleya sp. UBA1516]|uniref:hypothetical protein n=1 Tax=Olleya sp. UBA1516 TaxID=1947013 RepID=UPI0025E2C495|nr:hypothetical protein [Olleya sp. UBA1516]|tara:strand:+ start:358045 stop:359541 length:1497 start_codon:yes stop_codon:yes gene_type:complete
MNTNIEIDIVPYDIALKVIIENIKNFFINDVDEAFISPFIETDLAKLIDELKEDVFFVIEYPYVDKVYRDSYYNYYASKHYSYQRDCIRVSLFSNSIKYEDFLKSENHQDLNERYLGFFILRPTINALFGRSIISPEAFEENDYKLCLCRTESLVNGVKLDVDGFPHSSQDGETIKCAETTIWGLMEYFGNKYPDYKPALPAKIHKAIERFSYQRQLPSNGLTMDQISFALKEFGFGTRIYAEKPYGKEIFTIIDSYIESGIPIMLGLESGDIGHVVVAIGKQYTKEVDWENVTKESLEFQGDSISYFETSSIPAKYVIQDDNDIPYKLISLDTPGEHYEDKDCKEYKIDSIVIPLYQKIYLESVIAKELILEIIKDDHIGYKFDEEFVFRFYLTSSRSFKNHIISSNEITSDLKTTILLTKMPKFIWIGEFYNKETFNEEIKVALGIILLDATEANQESIDALIFAGYPDKCISLNENNFVNLHHKFENYRYFHNLK